MTVEDVRARVAFIKKISRGSVTRMMAENRLYVDVLRIIVNLAIVRAGARAFAEEALKVQE